MRPTPKKGTDMLTVKNFKKAVHENLVPILTTTAIAGVVIGVVLTKKFGMPTAPVKADVVNEFIRELRDDYGWAVVAMDEAQFDAYKLLLNTK
jgi:RNase H-fold protein (predicted Holliday junction resolvase)